MSMGGGGGGGVIGLPVLLQTAHYSIRTGVGL